MKIFRKLRVKSISENKTLKYLKYAVGEVVLLVIGIFIAVQLNNANEARKLKQVEIEILIGIKKDILQDTIDINFNVRGYNFLISNDSILLDELTHMREMDSMTLGRIVTAKASGLFIGLHHAHFDEVKLKGLSLIENDKLREKVSVLYDFTYPYLENMENEWDFNNHTKLMQEVMHNYLEYDTSGVILSKENYSRLLSDKYVHYHIAKSRKMKKRLMKKYDKVTIDIIDLLESIDQELKRLE